MRSDGFKDTLVICAIVVLFFTCAVIPSCVTISPPPIEATTTTTTTILPHQIYHPAWEKNHPERAEWTDVLNVYMRSEFKNILQASDWVRFCPKWESLGEDYKIDAVLEFFSWLTFYESSWDPSTASVDVGTVTNKNTHSIGLCQVSVIDYQNKWGYSYEQLLKAKENLLVCMNIFSEQVSSTGLMVLPNTHKKRYFATLLDGNKYDKTAQIAAKVAALPFCK